MTALKILQAREGNWHSPTESAAQMQAAVGEQVNRVPGKVVSASVSDLKFLKEMRSQRDGRENLLLNSAENVK